ncbi:MAG: AAA family ATPase [Candidatus Thermoplasmatota archaeon]
MLNKVNKEITADVFLKENYYLTHNPFKTEACTDPNEYVERENELALFESDLNLVKISGSTGKRIIGRKGIGKTSLVNMYFEVARKRGLKTVYVTVPNSARKFMQNLLIGTGNAETDQTKRDELRNKYAMYVRSNIYPETIFEKWSQLIDELKPKPVIVAIDETENLPKLPHVMPLFNDYIFSHANDVMFLLCCLPSTYEKLRTTAFIDRFPTVIRLRSFTNEELLLLFEKRLNTARVKQAPNKYWPFTKKAVEKLLDHAEGVPRYLIDVAREALNMGVKLNATQINEKIVEKGAVRAERGYIIGVWESLNRSEKQTLMEIVAHGGKVKLDDLISTIKKDKSLIWRCVNELVERGLVEKVGEAKKDVIYQLRVDPELVKDLIA